MGYIRVCQGVAEAVFISKISTCTPQFSVCEGDFTTFLWRAAKTPFEDEVLIVPLCLRVVPFLVDHLQKCASICDGYAYFGLESAVKVNERFISQPRLQGSFSFGLPVPTGSGVVSWCFRDEVAAMSAWHKEPVAAVI